MDPGAHARIVLWLIVVEAAHRLATESILLTVVVMGVVDIALDMWPKLLDRIDATLERLRWWTRRWRR